MDRYRAQRRSRVSVALAAVGAGVLALGVMVVVPAAAHATGPIYYAYPDGTATTGCGLSSTQGDECNLTNALLAAASGDTVVLEKSAGTGTATFTTTSGWTVLQDSLTIQSAFGVTAVLDGDDTSTVDLDYTGGGTLTVTGLTVEGTSVNDDYDAGGGIEMGNGGSLVVSASTFRDNNISSSYAAYGGGIDNQSGGTVTVSGSTFTANDASPGEGGGINDGAGGPLVVSDSTFDANITSGDGAGGGIANWEGGATTVVASTFVGNTIGAGGAYASGGLYIGSGDGDTVSVAGSLFADNSTDCSGSTTDITDSGYNIDSDGTCGFNTANHSVSDSTTLGTTLNSLADNGGSTQTVEPQAGSPAVAMIPNGTSVTIGGNIVSLCPATDQTGYTSADGAACNAGAVQQVQQPTVYAYPGGTATTGCGQSPTPADECDLTTALQVATSGDTVVLDTPAGTGTATFTTTSGWSVSQDSLTIQSASGVTAVLDGGGTSNDDLHYTGTGTLTVTGLTVEETLANPNHYPNNYGGGIVVWSSGSLVVSASTFYHNNINNYQNSGGGGIDSPNSGAVTVSGSTFTANNADGATGGGINNGGGALSVSDSTFDANITSGGGGVGGGIVVNGGVTTVVASTFVGNTGGGGAHGSGGVYNQGGGVSVAGSLFAGNSPDCTGTITDSGYNIDSDGTCGFTATGSKSDQTGLAGTLSALAGNGG